MISEAIWGPIILIVGFFTLAYLLYQARKDIAEMNENQKDGRK